MATPLHIVCVNAMTQDQLRKAQREEKKTRTIRTLISDCVNAGLPMPEREFMPIPGRRFRVDLYWDAARLCVEYEGGTMTHMRRVDPETGKLCMSRHLTPGGFNRDCTKYNRLQQEGYMVLRFDAALVNSGEAAKEIAAAYFSRVAEAQQRDAVEADLLLKMAIRKYGASNTARMLRAAVFGQDVIA